MVNEYLIKQTILVFSKIVNDLIDPCFKFPKGGASKRTVTQSLERLEKKYGSLSRVRIVDYLVCVAYTFRGRGEEWTIKQAFGPKTLERFSKVGQGQRYYEDCWLEHVHLSRTSLLEMIADKSEHPQSKYVYMSMEESTKSRMLNQPAGYIICQSSTLGWSPLSLACSQCVYVNKCKDNTRRKFPEIFRLRIEYGDK